MSWQISQHPARSLWISSLRRALAVTDRWSLRTAVRARRFRDEALSRRPSRWGKFSSLLKIRRNVNVLFSSVINSVFLDRCHELRRQIQQPIELDSYPIGDCRSCGRPLDCQEGQKSEKAARHREGRQYPHPSTVRWLLPRGRLLMNCLLFKKTAPKSGFR